MKQVDREPAVAGLFYEGHAKDLTNQLNRLFQNADQPRFPGKIRALIVPHAGYVYSGNVAASAYQSLGADEDYKTIFLIGSSHRVQFNGASVYACGDYVTPLGRAEVDVDLANQLMDDCSYIQFRQDAHEGEHTLEVQLPFLQHHLKKPFKIVPIIIASFDTKVCEQIAKTLKPYFEKGHLFVISSDFSHYPDAENALRVDKLTAEAICSNNPISLQKQLKLTENEHVPGLRTSLCGWTSVLTFLFISSQFPDLTFHLIRYMNSGQVPQGDPMRVVGYHAIAVIQGRPVKKMVLTEASQSNLLKWAHQNLRSLLLNLQVEPDEKAPADPALEQKAGAFVSLYNKGQLRGCIGRFGADEVLWKEVRDLTEAAALRDYRFSPVDPSELDDLTVEVSVLTPLQAIDGIEEIEIGRHGIYLRKGAHSGTFLPQVAVKAGWTREEFLGHCAKDKAGIGWDGWKDAEIFVYEAIVVKEE
jgi:hypothetical protein